MEYHENLKPKTYIVPNDNDLNYLNNSLSSQSMEVPPDGRPVVK